MKMCYSITCLQSSRTELDLNASKFKLTQLLYYKRIKYKLITLSTLITGA